MRKFTNREFVLVSMALWFLVIYLVFVTVREMSADSFADDLQIMERETYYQNNKDRIGPVVSEMEMAERLLSILEENHIIPESTKVSSENNYETGLSVGVISVTSTGALKDVAAFLDSIAASSDMRVTHYSIYENDGMINMEFTVQFIMLDERQAN